MTTERSNILLQRVEELLEIEKRFISVFYLNPVPAWCKFLTKDNHLLMGLVNPAYTRATGIAVAAYVGRPDSAVWTMSEPEEFNKMDRAVIRTGTPRRIAERAINPKTGKIQYWVGWKWPYMYNNKIVGVVGSAEPFNEIFWNQHGTQVLAALGEEQ